jgi:hypothetical protein
MNRRYALKGRKRIARDERSEPLVGISKGESPVRAIEDRVGFSECFFRSPLKKEVGRNEYWIVI